MAAKKMTIKMVAGLIAVLTISLVLPAISHAAPPRVSRNQIIAYAATGVRSRYVWGADVWNPRNRAWGGADCSGYVTKSWMVPRRVATTTSLGHPYSTYSFKYNRTYWYPVSRGSMQKADLMVYRSGGGGHVVLYHYGSRWGAPVVYEARGRAYGIIHGSRYFGSQYVARRRRGLISGTTAVAKPKPSPYPTSPAWTSEPRIIASRRIENGSYVVAQPSSYATKGLFLNTVNSGINNIFITNTGGAAIKKLSLFSNTKSYTVSQELPAYSGRDFTSYNYAMTFGETPALARITSDTPTLANVKAFNGYLYNSVPGSYASSRVYTDQFRTNEDILYVTNPYGNTTKATIYLHNNGKQVAKSTIYVSPKTTKGITWKGNSAVTNRAKNTFMTVLGNQPMLASKRLPSVSYQQMQPYFIANNQMFHETLRPTRDKLFIANTSATSKSYASIFAYVDGKRIHRSVRTIVPRDGIMVDYSNTWLRKYPSLTLVVQTKGGKVYSSRRALNGHYVNAVSKAQVTSRVYMDRYNARTEPIFAANPTARTINLRVEFFNNGSVVSTRLYTVKAADTVKLDYSDSLVADYRSLFVRMTASRP